MKTYTYLTVLAIAGSLAGAGCKSSTKSASGTDSTSSSQTKADSSKGFEKSVDGKQVHLYTLENKDHMKAAITNYGGRLVSLIVPDKDGKPTDVVAGFDSVDGYINSTEPYFGATIGRYGNRIAKGKFTLDGKTYQLAINNPPNTLHGGKKGFQAVVWDVRQINSHELELTYLSKDGEENFPGNLKVKVVYNLRDDNALQITYDAETDKNTPVNLTNHAFFNLNGESSGSILNHKVMIAADKYTPVDSTLIPTGKIEAVESTPFDFTTANTIGARANDNNEQLKNGKGYDHNFVLNAHDAKKPVAVVTGDKSGIVMQVFTDQPGLQFYSGNFMQAKNNMKGGHKDDYRTAFAMETQHFPDSPNQPSFPTTILKPGQHYHTVSVYQFSVAK
ncbi:aldose epimerase family protein [Mucilaginibacter sp. KACC 22063]|uniref:aldose epimerase family protein n=1 Tax=Mucilaginibacter sp. KACC 22063 TaxID=3025666 RepID=UPI002365CDE1|nr:aldose epimerase family protein [Mucilaginibacter sp. KACC 22063]WDF53979.1 galactose mutarotase [Mucilaginibacter sp. KACC 22063]